MVFVHYGKGFLRTLYGSISFTPGDHLLIPRGTIYQIDFETTDNRLFIVESTHPNSCAGVPESCDVTGIK